MLVEPDKDNFAMATLNTARLKNVRLHLGGTWLESSLLFIDRSISYGTQDGYVVRPMVKMDRASSSTCPTSLTSLEAIAGYSVDHLLKVNGWEGLMIDYVKIDCECCEWAMFTRQSLSSGWLEKTRCISLEVHEWCHPDVMHGLTADYLRHILLVSGLQDMGSFGELEVYCRDGMKEEL